MMSKNRERYKLMEKYMTIALLADAALFVLFLLFAGTGVIWLKVITAALAIVLSAACLAYLFITHELTRRRSLWMTASAAAVLICILASLLLKYPSVPLSKGNSTESGKGTTTSVSHDVRL